MTMTMSYKAVKVHFIVRHAFWVRLHLQSRSPYSTAIAIQTPVATQGSSSCNVLQSERRCSERVYGLEKPFIPSESVGSRVSICVILELVAALG